MEPSGALNESCVRFSIWCLLPAMDVPRRTQPAPEVILQEWYSAFDRELWACFAGIRHFRCMLKDREFTIFTNNKLLTCALRKA
jgi:hypothetical protein